MQPQNYDDLEDAVETVRKMAPYNPVSTIFSGINLVEMGPTFRPIFQQAIDAVPILATGIAPITSATSININRFSDYAHASNIHGEYRTLKRLIQTINDQRER